MDELTLVFLAMIILVILLVVVIVAMIHKSEQLFRKAVKKEAKHIYALGMREDEDE